MSVRLIAGRAGSGKTHWCLSRIQEQLASSPIDGPRLILLVPEQAALQMERGLLAAVRPSALGRCEVLSFRRLAHRILSQAAGPMPTPLSPIGRQMALRALLSRNRGRLQAFSRVADRGGFIVALSRGIVELLQESVTVEQLETAAAAAKSDAEPSAPRLADMALLYRAYLEFLGSDRVDPEGVLDLARARIDGVSWLTEAKVWIDGFAGLTPQQARMIVALARRAAQVAVALLIDRRADRAFSATDAPDELSLFARTERTCSILAGALSAASILLEPPLVLGADGCPRFKQASRIASLERHLFRPASAQGAEYPVGDNDSSQTGVVRFVAASDRRAEVAAAVTALIDLVQRERDPLRYRDVAFVVRDLEPYHDLLTASLTAHQVPYFIDRRRPAHHHPLIQLVRSVLAMLHDRSLGESVATMLKTGLSGLSDQAADGLENYILAHGLLAAGDWDEPWTYPASPSAKRRPAVAAARRALAEVERARDDLRRAFRDWWPASPGGEERLPCRKWVSRLVDLLERLAVRRQLVDWCRQATARGDLDEAEEHEQVWADMAKLFDEAAAALGDDLMSAGQFRDVVESALSQFTLGLVPATIDQVLVGSIERSRHPPVRAVFLLGFGEGEFPARWAEDSILDDDDRQRLEEGGIVLSQTRTRRLLDERMLAYIAVTRASETLWISYPKADEAGRPLAPSPFWQALLDALPDVAIESTDVDESSNRMPFASICSAGDLASELALRLRSACVRGETSPDREAVYTLYEWARSQPRVREVLAASLAAFRPPNPAALTPAAADLLWPRPYRTSITRLEQFAKCPFQHFAARGLRLEPRAEHEVSTLDLGRMYHSILEQFVNELMESDRSLKEMSPEEIGDSIGRLCQLVVPQYAQEVRIPPAGQQALIRRGRTQLSAAKRAEHTGLAKSPLRTAFTERMFGDSEGAGLPALELRTKSGKIVQVRGVIDRLDLVTGGDQSLAIVFDYKRTLGRSLRLDEVYHGLALQLMAYLLVIRDHGERLGGAKLIPGGAFYLPLLSAYQRVDHPSDAEEPDFDGFAAFRPRGVVDFDWIDRLDPDFDTGRSRLFSVKRKQDQGISDLDRGDAVPSGTIDRLLEHVRTEIGNLAERWLAGEISVLPAQIGTHLPCDECSYRSVCRVEYATRQSRRLHKMSRSQVIEQLGVEEAGPSDG